MIAEHITITDPVAEIIKAEIANGRYADFSSAVNDALWHYFSGTPNVFQEYKVTPEEVETSYQADLKMIKEARAKGTLVPL